MLSIIEKFYRANYGKLVKRMRWRAGTVQDAEDIVQEAFCRAIKYKESFMMGLPFNHWFQRILSNALRDHKNAEKGLSNSVEYGEEHAEPVDCPAYNKQLRRQIEEEMMLMDDESCEVVSLYFTYNYNLKDIVHITNVKYKTVDNIIQRFKHKIREKYGEKI